MGDGIPLPIIPRRCLVCAARDFFCMKYKPVAACTVVNVLSGYRFPLDSACAAEFDVGVEVGTAAWYASTGPVRLIAEGR